METTLYNKDGHAVAYIADDGDGTIYSYMDPRWANSYMFYSSFASGRLKKFFSDCFVASRPIKERDSVKGIFLGQTRTQFCAFPQPAIPSSPKTAFSLSDFSNFPVGFELNRRT